MTRVPYFNFYPSDFMNGVRGLTAQEVGVYTMLLCRIYEESGPVEYHVRRLATYCGMREATFAAVVDKLVDLDKIQLVDGRLTNRRADGEIAKRADGLKIASRAGKASAEKKQQNQRQASTPVERPSNHTDTDTDKYSVANATDGGAISAPDDLAKDLFERGVRFLGKHGVKESQARAFIGRCRKYHPDDHILSAFMACANAGAIDPIPWITRHLITPKPFKMDLSSFGVTQ